MMKTLRQFSLLASLVFLMLQLCGCKEHYSDGEKVGTLIEFAKSGLVWDSWDGRLNMTQTGMNTAGEPFEFSFDNDRDDQDSLITLLQQAQVEGWKIKIKYHFNYFVDDVTVLDKNFANVFRDRGEGRQGRVVDTIYVVIDKSEIRKKQH